VVTSSLLQLREDIVWQAGHAQVDVLRGAGALDAKLEREATFERSCVSEHCDDAREEAIEHEELPLARELGAALRGCTEPILEGPLERLGGLVRANGQAAIPPYGASAASTSASSSFVTRPR
jgi:hypothetical protein